MFGRVVCARLAANHGSCTFVYIIELTLRPFIMLLMQERATPSKAAGTPIQGLVMGATDNSYLLRGDTFDVMRNVEGGVEDKGGQPDRVWDWQQPRLVVQHICCFMPVLQN